MLPGTDDSLAVVPSLAMHLRPAIPGRGAAQVFQARAHQRANTAAIGSPVGMTRTGRSMRHWPGSAPSPHVFPTRPNLALTMGGAVVGSETSAHVPGRLPPTGWSGDPGADQPDGSTV